MALRGKYSLLITDILSGGVKPEAMRSRRDSLQDEYRTVSELSPQTSSVDYTTAQSQLGLTGGDSEQYTWSDSEINKFLPNDLR